MQQKGLDRYMTDVPDEIDVDLRSDLEVFSDIIRETMELYNDPDISAHYILNSERFVTIVNTAYGDGVKDGLETSE